MRSTIMSCNSSTIPRLRKVAIALRSRFASSEENFAASSAIFIACSWKIGTPKVRPRMLDSSSGGPCRGLGAGITTGSAPRRRLR